MTDRETANDLVDAAGLHISGLGDLAASIESALTRARAEALEEAKQLFRQSTDAKGGCRMLSQGDDCKCFLCLCDSAKGTP